MRNFFQALKLHLRSSYIYYVLNLLFVIAMTALIYFFKNETVLYVLVLAWLFIFTFFLGYYTYKVLGKTYYSLKHDRHLFINASIFVNVLNAILMSLISFGIFYLINDNIFNSSSMVIILNIASIFTALLTIYALGNFYSLYLSKYKVLSIILVLALLVLLLFVSKYIMSTFNSFIKFDDSFIWSNNMYHAIPIGLFIIFIIINTFNKHKYVK